MSELDTPELAGPRVAVLLGMPGCGKTTRSLARWESFSRCVALDTRLVRGVGEYPGIVATTPAELAELLRKLGDEPRWRITYRGPLYSRHLDPTDEHNGIAFEVIFAALKELENVLVVVDEADKCCSAIYTPPGLYAMAHYGRRIGQAVTLCARRAANIPRDITTTADEVVAWPVDEPADRKYLDARGFDLQVLDTLSDHAALVRRRREDGTSTFVIER